MLFFYFCRIRYTFSDVLINIPGHIYIVAAAPCRLRVLADAAALANFKDAAAAIDTQVGLRKGKGNKRAIQNASQKN